jgi:hypothetical protein
MRVFCIIFAVLISGCVHEIVDLPAPVDSDSETESETEFETESETEFETESEADTAACPFICTNQYYCDTKYNGSWRWAYECDMNTFICCEPGDTETEGSDA